MYEFIRNHFSMLISLSRIATLKALKGQQDD